jgi:hypothetical protein
MSGPNGMSDGKEIRNRGQLVVLEAINVFNHSYDVPSIPLDNNRGEWKYHIHSSLARFTIPIYFF